MAPPKVLVVINRAGGGQREDPDALARLFEEQGAAARIRLVAPDELASAFRAAAADRESDIVVAAGGDGTVGTAAAALAGTRRALGIVPSGTRNHFARDAGIPLDHRRAVATICTGERRTVDVAEVNGHVFVNNSAVGLYPEMVRFRDADEARTGRRRRLSMLGAGLRALRGFETRRLWISAEGLETPVRTPLLFVGNNRYRLNLLALGRREAIDRGELCLYAVRTHGRAPLLWAGIRGLLGRLDQQRDFVTAYVKEAEILADRPRLTLSADGETLTLATPLRYRIRPRALTVIAPAEAPEH